MSSQDVRAILELPQQTKPAPSAAVPRRATSHYVKKPGGISRELFALMGDNAPAVVESHSFLAKSRYKHRTPDQNKQVQWKLCPVLPQREPPVSAPLTGIRRWNRFVDGAEALNKDDYFSQYNFHGPSIMEYSQMEYDQHLGDAEWTQDETNYLFGCLRKFDLRFVVIADRYEYHIPKSDGRIRRRTIEEIKERYYTICRRLVRTRTASDAQNQQQLLQAYSFDKAREIRRKQYVSELFHLTLAEIAEEEALYVEIKRIEQADRRYKADRDNLMRSIIGLDSGLMNLDQVNGEGVVGMDRSKKRKRHEDSEPAPVSMPVTSKTQKESAAFDSAHCIHRTVGADSQSSQVLGRHPAHIPAYLRSSKLPVPRSTAAIRITELLAELGVNSTRLVMPTRNNIEELDRLLTASAALVDMKRHVDRVEQELRTLRIQAEGLVVSSSRTKVRSESVISRGTSSA